MMAVTTPTDWTDEELKAKVGQVSHISMLHLRILIFNIMLLSHVFNLASDWSSEVHHVKVVLVEVGDRAADDVAMMIALLARQEKVPPLTSSSSLLLDFMVTCQAKTLRLSSRFTRSEQ